MSKSNSTVSSEPVKISSLSHTSVPVIQPSLDHNGSHIPSFIHRSIDSLGYNPQIPPSSYGSLLGQLGSPSMHVGMLKRLQRNYGNNYVGEVIQCKGESGGACTECPEKLSLSEEEKKKKLQRKGESSLSSLPAGVMPALQRTSGGSPLSSETRSFMESRFGRDFSDVRVHTDSSAADAAQQLRAQAFTSGRDIYFGSGRLQPQTPEGQKLLAHELTHVVHQRSGAVGPSLAKPIIGTPGDFFEKEADRAEQTMLSGRIKVVGLESSPGLRCKGESPHADLKGTERILPIDDPLIVPGEKGNGEVKREYQKAVKDDRLSTLAKFSRPGTDTLRRIWKDKSGADFPENFTVGGDVCEVDHIVELQVGGTNNKENLQLLEKSNNASSGSNIRGQVDALKNKYGSDVVLRFTKVKFESPKDDRCKKKEIELGKKGAKAIAAANVATVTFGTRAIDIDLDKAKKLASDVYDLGGRRGQIVAGIAFLTLTWPGDGQGNGQIDAVVTSGAANFIKNKKDKNVVIEIKSGKAELSPTNKVLKLLFPFLSEADFNARLDDQGLGGEGKFNPTLPLLKNTEFQLRIEGGKFSGGVKLASKDVNIPIPGVAITESSIEVRLEESQFSATGVLAFKVGTIAEVKLQADADKNGFIAVGTVDLFIPGLDKAQGQISYADRKLLGQIEIGKDKFKLPGVKSAKLQVNITDRELFGAGEVLLDIPGIKKGTLGFGIDKEGNYAITGIAELSIPGLKSAIVGLTYRDNDFEGFAKVGLDIPGLEGAGAAFEIKYAKGAITGTGDFEYKKGRLSGKVHAELNEKRKLKGGGELGYEIIPGLVAAVGMELREDGTTKISGELRIPEKIELFPQKSIDKKIFGFGVQIPIFAIPLGPRSVGLVAEIGADMNARAGIGPGQIRQLKVKAAFDPAKEESKFEFSGSGELYVPAFAELALGVHGGIGLSIAIASATGGIELVAGLGLQGALSAMVQIAYLNNQFAVNAVAELSAQPSLKFDVNAYVKVEISLIFTTIEVYRKDWNLASKEWGSGLKIGLRFPVRYVFGQPFELSLDQVEFIVPEINVKQAVKDLLPM